MQMNHKDAQHTEAKSHAQVTMLVGGGDIPRNTYFHILKCFHGDLIRHFLTSCKMLSFFLIISGQKVPFLAESSCTLDRYWPFPSCMGKVEASEGTVMQTQRVTEGRGAGPDALPGTFRSDHIGSPNF